MSPQDEQTLQTLVRQYAAETDIQEQIRIYSRIRAIYACQFLHDELDESGFREIMHKPALEVVPEPVWHGIAREGEYEGFRNYRSPFNTDTDYADGGAFCSNLREHYNWCWSREQYSQTGQRHYLTAMLANVTADNPPPAPVKEPNPSIRKFDIFDFFYITVVGLTGIAIGGIIGGWDSVMAVAFTMSAIYFVGWLVNR